jgi:O-methyltransferase
MAKGLLGKLFGAGVQPPEFPPDFDDASIALCRAVQPYTMTSKERVFALRQSVEYIVRAGIPGDIVECGVWKGGSMMAVALSLKELGQTRRLHLFDTFEGMSEPTGVDKTFRGEAAGALMAKNERETSAIWAFGALDEVKKNVLGTGYDPSLVEFVQGKVEDTLPARAPEQIALLRLDTDWYESTKHELTHLYPRLSVGGVLIIDDYGHWEGARKAVDEYVREMQLKVLLQRIDYTGRACIKPAS